MTMPRPGPLRDLPLDRFSSLDPNPAHATPYASNRPTKRPLSPGSPILFSPAKRRILNEEGIFLPDKTVKSPISALRNMATPMVCFSDILQGADSPAKKLDFGPPKNQGTPGVDMNNSQDIPTFATSSSVVLLDPPVAQPRDGNLHRAFEECFGPLSPPSPSSVLRRPAAFVAIPREMPPPPNPQSPHYPGFLIYQDPHRFVNTQPHPSGTSSMKDVKGECKENTPPRRSPSQVAPIDGVSDPKGQTGSSGSKQRPQRKSGLTSAHSLSEKLSTRTDSPSSILSGPSSETKKALRRMMEDEVDGFDDDIEVEEP